MQPDQQHLDLPFFEPAHREFAPQVSTWVHAQQVDETDDRTACRTWVRTLGDAGWLRPCVRAEHGGMFAQIDSRALVLMRETLAFYSPLADFAFAMQGLGSGAISLAASDTIKADYLPAVCRGKKIAAFALSEPAAGSDVAAIATTAVRTGAGWQLDGTKTWISNGGLADFYCVFARTDVHAGVRGLSAFLVDAKTAGLDDTESIHVMAPHPLAKIKMTACVVPDSHRLGEVGEGFKLAMRTLDIFRTSVAGAALGMARRALAEALAYSKARKMFGQHLIDFQLTQAQIGEMITLIDAAALLTYRAAWLRDVKGQRTTVDAAMAKMTATENAQRVIDMALQMHGGRGVEIGAVIEHLYRDIRALRIYEGATEVQQLIIGKSLL
jgi:acyl-CoA dehydrogenase